MGIAKGFDPFYENFWEFTYGESIRLQSNFIKAVHSKLRIKKYDCCYCFKKLFACINCDYKNIPFSGNKKLPRFAKLKVLENGNMELALNPMKGD